MVLGVDTVVVAGDDEILGKPGSEEEARASLERLRGREHEVWSGLALIEPGRERTASAVTLVTFRWLEVADIDAYVATGEWRGRAGGYAIQERGAALVERIEGDYLNVVGLPVAELMRLAPELTSLSVVRSGRIVHYNPNPPHLAALRPSTRRGRLFAGPSQQTQRGETRQSPRSSELHWPSSDLAASRRSFPPRAEGKVRCCAPLRSAYSHRTHGFLLDSHRHGRPRHGG